MDAQIGGRFVFPRKTNTGHTGSRQTQVDLIPVIPIRDKGLSFLWRVGRPTYSILFPGVATLDLPTSNWRGRGQQPPQLAQLSAGGWPSQRRHPTRRTGTAEGGGRVAGGRLGVLVSGTVKQVMFG